MQIREPLPPKQITVRIFRVLGLEKFVDKEVERNIVAPVNHFAYVTATEAVFDSLATAVLPGSYLGWLPALGILPSANKEGGERNALMITAHVV